jgi:predicted transposase/invertase (TIGR01784 family)
MRPGIDPKVDYAFKKLFGSETTLDVLSDVLHAVLQPPPGRQFVDLTILNPFNEKDSTDDKLSVLDIKARDASGRLFNIEMQMIAPWFFPQRVLYYWAKVYQQQLVEGNDYHELRPTISISFLDSVLFRQVDALHHRFSLVDPQTQLRLTDDLEIHIVELPKFALRAEELSSSFDMWCYFLRHGETLDTAHLPAALEKPIIHRAMEVLNVLSQTDLERERYEARMKGRRDEASYQAEMARIEDRGILIGRIQDRQEMQGQTPTAQEELKKLSLEELSRLFEQLRKNVPAPTNQSTNANRG